MDQVKIGRFIAQRRKQANLTQMQLAEKLGITDRAVSKWENGRAMPDASAMPELCRILNISINDLFSGEVVSVENYQQELETRLIEMAQQKEESDRQLLTMEWVIAILSLIILFIPIFVSAYLPLEDWVRCILLFVGMPPAIFGLCFAIKIEQVAGYYECRKCSHQYVPTYKAVTMAPHYGRTRYMTCPQCSKRSWQRKVIHKD